MDLEIRTQGFKSFLTRCHLDKIVDDLVITTKGSNIQAIFSPKDGSVVCEINEPLSRCFEEGNIKLPSISGLISQINRIDEASEFIRIVTNNEKIIITDGKTKNKSNIKITQVADEQFVNSYQRMISSTPTFLKEPKFKFLDNEYNHMLEISVEIVQTILKDAKAFGYDIYILNEVDSLLNCTIKTKSKELADSFSRKLPIISKMGEGVIPKVQVGFGFREVMKAFCEKMTETVKIYFHEKSILITDGIKSFYNLNTVPQD